MKASILAVLTAFLATASADWFQVDFYPDLFCSEAPFHTQNYDLGGTFGIGGTNEGLRNIDESVAALSARITQSGGIAASCNTFERSDGNGAVVGQWTTESDNGLIRNSKCFEFSHGTPHSFECQEGGSPF
jgi:hypothetical protein